MNKTKIEWTDRTWNPYTGCLNGCWYCFAKKLFTRFGWSFEPTFHPERLNDAELKKSSMRVFVCSVADLFAEWTKPEWQKQVLDTMAKHPQHIYQLLTKQPQGIPEGSDFGDNVWVGVTITRDDEMDKMYMLCNRYKGNKFISFEPLLSPVKISSTDGYIDKIGWIIVGKLTGSKRVPLDKEAVSYVLREAKARGIPIFIKNNVGWQDKIQEFPSASRQFDEEAKLYSHTEAAGDAIVIKDRIFRKAGK